MAGTTLATRGLNLPAHDYILLDPAATPNNGIQTIYYRRGGASGDLVATLEVTYVNGQVSTVVRS